MVFSTSLLIQSYQFGYFYFIDCIFPKHTQNNTVQNATPYFPVFFISIHIFFLLLISKYAQNYHCFFYLKISFFLLTQMHLRYIIIRGIQNTIGLLYHFLKGGRMHFGYTMHWAYGKGVYPKRSAYIFRTFSLSYIFLVQTRQYATTIHLYIKVKFPINETRMLCLAKYPRFIYRKEIIKP